MTIDTEAYKAEQRANWDLVGPALEGWLSTMEIGLAPITERLVALAGVEDGHSVLDLGTGHGEPALTAARIVGPNGRVVGVDLSPKMIEAARRRAEHLSNAEFVVGDFESVDALAASYDVVLSRFALMLATDHVATFRGIARVLKPGGVFAASVWGSPERNPLAAGIGVLVRHLGLPSPPPRSPGTFGMSDRSALADELGEAGFIDIEIEEQTAPFRLESPAAYVRLTADVLAPKLEALADQDAWTAVEQAVSPYVEADGTVSLPSQAWCLRATRP